MNKNKMAIALGALLMAAPLTWADQAPRITETLNPQELRQLVRLTKRYGESVVKNDRVLIVGKVKGKWSRVPTGKIDQALPEKGLYNARFVYLDSVKPNSKIAVASLRGRDLGQFGELWGKDPLPHRIPRGILRSLVADPKTGRVSFGLYASGKLLEDNSPQVGNYRTVIHYGVTRVSSWGKPLVASTVRILTKLARRP